MKPLTVILFLVLTSLAGFSQASNIDDLISKLDNQKLFGTCNYVWVLKNGSKEADSLIAIGKTNGTAKPELCKRLYNLLTDTTKGIITHYILTNILQKDQITSGTIYFDTDSTTEYDYSGLRFYENYRHGMFADVRELEHNKKVWAVLFRQMKLIN